MTFCCLREVAKENIIRYERSMGDISVGTQFKKVIDQSVTEESANTKDEEEGIEMTIIEED